MNEVIAECLRAEDRLEHGVDIVAAKSLDWQIGDDARALEVRDEARQPRSGLLTPIGEGNDDWLRRVGSRDVEDELQRRIVAPVHVLEGEENGLGAGERAH